jgi:flavodoxin
MSKKLVAYFSASGVTKQVAERLAAIVEADLFEIKPKIPYTKADLDWMDKKSRSSLEMQDKAVRPEIAGTLENIADYNIIFLGFPIWWHVAPQIINTFLESGDFSGKTIVLFATSGSSGLGNTLNALKPSCSNSTKIIEGKVLNHMSDQDITDWVHSLSL